jgi:DNA photolyase
MDTAIVVFTRDLRLHDNPALHQACARARQVVPLFVVDPALGTRSANRAPSAVRLGPMSSSRRPFEPVRVADWSPLEFITK